MDGVRNQGEADVDCGGATSCPRCADFKTCGDPSDCQTATCTMGYCGPVGCQAFGMSGGYTGCERTVPVASLPCEDIRVTGTRTGVANHGSVAVTLPFSFPFFGTPATAVQINAQGTLTFNATTSSTSNSCLPSGTTPQLAAYWEHLHPEGNVYHQTVGTMPNRRFVVQWVGTIFGGGTGTLDVRAVLKEGRGDIEVCYVATTTTSASYSQGTSATAAIQSSAGTALQYSCNAAKLVDGLMLTYIAP
jgi:hypothetical protein